MTRLSGTALALTAAAALLSTSPALAQEPSPVTVSAEGVTLDFQNAELRLVIAALAEAGGLNVVYGDLPNRRVTLRIAQPIPVAKIRSVLSDVAGANGLTIEENGGILRVSPEREEPRAPTRAPPSAGDDDAVRLFVYHLNHAPAERLASTLQSLFGGGGAAGGGGIQRRSFSSQMRDQNIRPEDLEALRPGGPGEVRVDTSGGAISMPGSLSGPVQIVADELSNALLVRATPRDWAVIRDAIDALDLRPLQVLIEVLIAEVRRDRTHDLGISATTPASADDDGNVTFDDRVGASLLGDTDGNLRVVLRDLGSVDVDVTLSALAASGRVRILSRPVLLAQNNLEAHILVGSERPFVQVFRTLPTEAATRDQIVQYRDVGTQLTILPTINPDGYVNLQVVQEVSNATSESQFGAPIISTREASTSIFIHDGRTAVIGGLIDSQTERTRTGIPLLKDIPLLGWLFGSTHDSRISTELFLFITPHIVRTDQDLERVRRGVDDRTGLIGEALDENPPVLPADVAAPDSAAPAAPANTP